MNNQIITLLLLLVPLISNACDMGLLDWYTEDSWLYLGYLKDISAEYDPKPGLKSLLDPDKVMNGFWVKRRNASQQEKDQAFANVVTYRSYLPWPILRRNVVAGLLIGANPNSVRDKRDPVIFTVLKENDDEVIRMLCAHGARLNCRYPGYKTTPLHHAKTVAIAELLIKHGASVKDLGHHKNNLLHSVIFHRGEPRLIPFYAQLGVDKNDTDESGATPFVHFCWSLDHFASDKRRAYFVEFAKLGITDKELEKGIEVVKAFKEYDQWQADYEFAMKTLAARNLKQKKLIGLTNQHLVEKYLAQGK